MNKRTRAAFTLNLSDNAFYIVKWWFGDAEVCVDVSHSWVRIPRDK
jgi:hypothetical protein